MKNESREAESVEGALREADLGYHSISGDSGEVLAAEVRRLEALASGLEKERDNWMESAAQFSRNSDFYRGLVTGIGAQFGEVAYISDDGSKQQDVLCLKVPELVAALLSKAAKGGA